MDTQSITTPASASLPANILVFATSDDHRKEIARVLSNAGHLVDFLPSIEEAQARITSGDLLIVSTAMLSEREYTLLEAVRQSETVWHVSVILLADAATSEQSNRSLALGAADCLGWPLQPDRLLARVNAAVARKRQIDRESRFRTLGTKGNTRSQSLFGSIIPTAGAMLHEKDPVRLLEMVLAESMRIADSEGGTIYMRSDEDELHFVLVRNDKLNINMGGSVGKPISFPPLKLKDADGKPNDKYVACHVATSGAFINIPDAYEVERFDFSGTKKFDQSIGYRSKSFLTVPLKNENQFVTGVLQLINARNPLTGAVANFNLEVQATIEVLGLLAAAIMDAHRAAQGQKRKAD